MVSAARHALQLGAGVVLAYAAAAALGLPERFWVVMTVLIVMRVDLGTTLDAGRERVLGTVLGALCGLGGAYAQAQWAEPGGLSLAVVALLAAASAAWAPLRSGAVAALIVLGAQALPGVSPLQAAALRVVQIVLGVLVAVAVVALSARLHTQQRLLQGCARVLERMAALLQHVGQGGAWAGDPGGARSAALRQALAALAWLADSADRQLHRRQRNQARWRRLRGARQRAPAAAHRRVEGTPYRQVVGLTAQLVQHTVALARLARQPLRAPGASQAGDGATAQQARASLAAAAQALQAAAQRLHGGTAPDCTALHAAIRACAQQVPLCTLSGPLQLCAQDLEQLCASPVLPQCGAAPG
ncbi:MAG: FUSC family protein [Rhodoferax sp.]